MNTPRNKVKTVWSKNLAYVIGLITTDGNLSIDGRHINITSKDKELIQKSKKCLSIDNKIGRKARGGSKEKRYYVLQFGDINFYRFLLNIGLMPKKSKIIKSANIPVKFFPDFFRGCIDGDGSIVVAKHPESKHPQLRLRLVSASLYFSRWMLKQIKINVKCSGGWIYTQKKKVIHSVSFGKEDSVKIIKFMYYSGVEYYLQRKFTIAKKWMSE